MGQLFKRGLSIVMNKLLTLEPHGTNNPDIKDTEPYRFWLSDFYDV
jgi:hypothetical protein